MSALDRILPWRRPPEQDQGDPGLLRMTLGEYVQAINFAGSQYIVGGGPQQTLAGNNERVGSDFVGLVQGAYAANGVVFACMLARQLVFSAVRFQWQVMRAGRPSELFGTAALELLETPWPGGTTQDLLNRIIQDADLAGSSYWVPDTPLSRLGGDGGTELVRMRPDWVEIVLRPRMMRTSRTSDDAGQVGWAKAGYIYSEGGPGVGDPVPFLANEVAQFSPLPDPLANYRGMSWLTPIIREIQADRLMTTHKRRFFENGATPNMIITYPAEETIERIREFAKLTQDEHAGADNAWKTMHLGGGADPSVVGANMAEVSFRDVQGAGETRIAAAARVSPVIVGLSEGLGGSSLNAGNYGQARRNFADGTMHPLWQNVAGTLQVVAGPKPRPGTRLWYDARDVPFLREDEKDAAQIQFTRAQTLRQWLDGGFTPESALAALSASDEGLLKHSGWFSVQLQQPGATTGQPATAKPDPNGGVPDASSGDDSQP